MADLPLSTVDVKQEVAIRKGEGEFSNLPSKTVIECFDAVIEKYGDKPALHQKFPVKVRRSLSEDLQLLCHGSLWIACDILVCSLHTEH